ncbi:uncharacterized protein LOC110110013 [Dendrobium catenatum]|uniref:uncharacterized protein LOC110110013 n=1 Tax=Dendrobium catenatum TaxID=906689 RepID=UPI0010A02FCD|nr:uncharacterized protein LOC110110013 [Dendrobium catenatum]
MKHLGPARPFLSISIQSLPDKHFLSQPAHAHSFLQQANLLNFNPLANPSCMKQPTQLSQDNTLKDPNTYQRLTGALQYLTITRPDIAYAVNILFQHMHDPEPSHIHLLKRLLRYIKGMVHFGLSITKTNLHLCTFSDAYWAGDPITRKSTSKYCTFFCDTLISWTVKKQTTVSRSSIEFEYHALAAATTDIIYLKRLLADFNIGHGNPVYVYCDNTSAIALANNPVFHARTKHIEIGHRFIRDYIQQHNIRFLPISTVDQLADILTKPLAMSRFKILRTKLMIMQDPSVCGDY